MEIVKIGAMWCPGCLVMKKVWKQIEEKYPELQITSLDIDFDEEEVLEYNVGDTLPVIVFKKDNKELKRIIGEKKYEDLVEVIEGL